MHRLGLHKRVQRIEKAAAADEGEEAGPPEKFDPATLEKAVVFCEKYLKFKPTPYETELLDDDSKRIYVCWSRQSGKSTTLAARMIHRCLKFPGTLRLIVAPGLRQSMIMMDKIEDFIYAMPKSVRRELLSKIQRTTLRFKNGSRIVALPNSPNLLRGYSAAEVLCDEAAFFRDDELIFFNVLYPMLQKPPGGTLIASSTPWGKDTVFYKFSQNPDFTKHHITWKEVVDAKLASRAFIEEMRRSMPTERFRREFEAEFTEDETAYLPQDLITRCIDSHATFIPDSYFGF
ncbi:MAG: terminase family protein [Candidatus Bathyarchaeia archaeon]